MSEKTDRVGRFHLRESVLSRDPVYASFTLRSVEVLNAFHLDDGLIRYIARSPHFDEIEFSEHTTRPSQIPLYSIVDESESAAGPRWRPEWGEMGIRFVRRSGEFDEGTP